MKVPQLYILIHFQLYQWTFSFVFTYGLFVFN